MYFKEVDSSIIQFIAFKLFIDICLICEYSLAFLFIKNKME